MIFILRGKTPKKAKIIKSFKEVRNEMDNSFKDCLMTTSEFLDYMESGSISDYDGVGDIHDGTDFITDGFKTNIFDFVRNKASEMTKEEFIEQYPYVAWYNK